ncbi:MAG: hypothetical protein ACPIOQ_70665 [Promethearchaeia archaeon]|jgi:hypothetical protein
MKFTLIFKVPSSAGQLPVPLAASMDDEKDVSGELERYKGQAKKIMRQTSSTSPSPCTIEVGSHGDWARGRASGVRLACGWRACMLVVVDRARAACHTRPLSRRPLSVRLWAGIDAC